MMQTNTGTNFTKMASCCAGRCKYAFVDSDEHRADRILIGALIPTSFEYQERQRVTEGYELRICSFESRYESWFLNCMADLAWVLEGDAQAQASEDPRDSYDKACKTLLRFVEAA